jgi:hypothetical protein
LLRRPAARIALAGFRLQGFTRFAQVSVRLGSIHLDAIHRPGALPGCVRWLVRAERKRSPPQQAAQPTGQDRSQGSPAVGAVHQLLINSG